MATLNTKRLILRPILANDMDDIFKYASDPNVGPNAGWKPHESREETLEIMHDIFLNKENVWGIEEKKSGDIIGSIGLIEDPKREYDRVKMIGYAIGKPYWGKGFMTEAVSAVIEFGFEELHLSAISAYCFPFNVRSKNIIKKFNFDYEGTMKMVEKLFDANIYDHECYLLTNEKYDSRKA